MHTPPPDAELHPEDLLRLIRAAVDGDPRAQTELYERYWPRLEREARHLYRTPVVGPEDLPNLLWVKLFSPGNETLLRYRPLAGSHFSNYLRVLQSRLAKDEWLKHSRQVGCDPCDLDAIVNPDATADQRLVADELAGLAWHKLSQVERDVWNLWIIEGLRDDAEIGRRLGKSANNVYQIRHRIRQKLRGFLGLPPDDEDPPDPQDA